jgi:hypothetical protein
LIVFQAGQRLTAPLLRGALVGGAALALVACGGTTDPVDLAGSSWEGRVEIDAATGDLDVPGLNDYIDREQPDWAADPERLVATALQIGRSREDAGPFEIDVDEADADRPVVTVTFTDLPDDSTEAVRYALSLERADDGLYRFADGSWSQRCQPGRGQSDFTSAHCI